MSSDLTATDSRDRLAAVLVVLVLAGVYWTTMGGHTTSVDGELYLLDVRSFVHHTTVLSPTPGLNSVVNLAVVNKNGDTTTHAPLGLTLLLLPGFVVGRLASLVFAQEDREEVTRLIFLAANPLITALTGGLLVLLCRALGASLRSAATLAMVFGLCTWAWAHGNSDFSEPATALMMTWASLASVKWWAGPTLRRAAVVGFLAGAVVLTRASTVLFVPIFLIAGLAANRQHTAPGRGRQLVAFMLAGFVPAAVFIANSVIRFGTPFTTGYRKFLFNAPLYEGLFGLFLSPGKGLFWYAPICVVAMFGLRRSYIARRRYAVFVGAVMMVHLAVVARVEFWHGDFAYGPRYLIPMLPILIALIAPIIDTGREWMLGVKVAALVGFVVPGLLGSLMYFNAVYWHNEPHVARDIEVVSPTTTQFFRAWDFQPRSSPLILQIRSLPDLFRNTVDRVVGDEGGITPIPEAYEDRIHWYARAIELDTWWAWWSARDGPAAAYLLLLAPLGAFVVAARILRRLRVVDSCDQTVGASPHDSPSARPLEEHA